MKTNIITTIVSVLIFSSSFFGQTTVDVSESTLKVSALGEEIFYYGFAEGDQLVFNFEEVNGKELKEVEIIELPSSSKFMDYKTKKIENKTLNITKTGIYKFRFLNTTLGGRICKFKIQRIAANEATKNFNTSVYWKTAYDTTYTTEQEKYLVKADTIVSNITDQVAKVHSGGNFNGNRTSFNFSLPNNVVAWSYYIGVDQAGQQAYQNAVKEISTKSAPLVSKIPGYGPLAALALGGASFLTVCQQGEDIDFYFLDTQTSAIIKKGKVINDYSKMNAPLKGNFIVYLDNDNAITGVTVAVKITAIIINQEWGTRPIKKINVASRKEAYLKN